MSSVAHVEATGYDNNESNSTSEALRWANIKVVEEHAVAVRDKPSTSTASASDGPISSLLEELLVIIFDDVIASESLSWNSPRGQPATGWRLESPPRNLASVSRAWRDIVFGCPMLWRHVVLTPTQPIHALREHLRNSSQLPIHLIVHQWPFRIPIVTGPYSIVALTAQLQAILTSEGDTVAPACQRIESITIHATESSNFPNFILQTWTGRGSKFPALRHVKMHGNVCATWSRVCFFNDENAPALERLELTNVVIAYNAYRLPWATGLNLTTLVWSAPTNKYGSLIVSVACFHHIVSSFPNLIKLELHGHVVGLEFVTPGGLEGSGIAPMTHVRDLRISGTVFLSSAAALVLFYLLPSLTRLVVRGKACTGPGRMRAVMLTLQALMCVPRMMEWSVCMLEALDELVLECVDGSACGTWKVWFDNELAQWEEWRSARMGLRAFPQVRVQVNMIDGPAPEDEELDEI